MYWSEIVMTVVGRVIWSSGLPPLCHATSTFLSAKNDHLRVSSLASPSAQTCTRGRLQVIILWGQPAL